MTRPPPARPSDDVDLELVGDRRAETLAKFWKLDARERLRFIGALRGGGSMSPEVFEALAAERGPASRELDGGACGATSEGRFTLLEGVEVNEAHWVGDGEGGASGEVRVEFDDGGGGRYDFVWLATGGNLDLGLVPLLASLLAQRPIETAGGLPLLRPDLSWDSGCPLYVMGAFAQLQLGADALNLAGARSGGVIIARALIEARDGAHTT